MTTDEAPRNRDVFSCARSGAGGAAGVCAEGELRIAVLEDRVAELSREGEMLREDLRALALVLAELVPTPEV
jgi:hypothetical protein